MVYVCSLGFLETEQRLDEDGMLSRNRCLFLYLLLSLMIKFLENRCFLPPLLYSSSFRCKCEPIWLQLEPNVKQRRACEKNIRQTETEGYYVSTYTKRNLDDLLHTHNGKLVWCHLFFLFLRTSEAQAFPYLENNSDVLGSKRWAMMMNRSVLVLVHYKCQAVCYKDRLDQL